ncbi:hypothetical protein PG984_011427 [Apiospora sp. TS-2023a]
MAATENVIDDTLDGPGAQAGPHAEDALRHSLLENALVKLKEQETHLNNKRVERDSVANRPRRSAGTRAALDVSQGQYDWLLKFGRQYRDGYLDLGGDYNQIPAVFQERRQPAEGVTARDQIGDPRIDSQQTSHTEQASQDLPGNSTETKVPETIKDDLGTIESAKIVESGNHEGPQPQVSSNLTKSNDEITNAGDGGDGGSGHEQQAVNPVGPSVGQAEDESRADAAPDQNVTESSAVETPTQTPTITAETGNENKDDVDPPTNARECRKRVLDVYAEYDDNQRATKKPRLDIPSEDFAAMGEEVRFVVATMSRLACSDTTQQDVEMFLLGKRRERDRKRYSEQSRIEWLASQHWAKPMPVLPVPGARPTKLFSVCYRGLRQSIHPLPSSLKMAIDEGLRFVSRKGDETDSDESVSGDMASHTTYVFDPFEAHAKIGHEYEKMAKIVEAVRVYIRKAARNTLTMEDCSDLRNKLNDFHDPEPVTNFLAPNTLTSLHTLDPDDEQYGESLSLLYTWNQVATKGVLFGMFVVNGIWTKLYHDRPAYLCTWERILQFVGEYVALQDQYRDSLPDPKQPQTINMFLGHMDNNFFTSGIQPNLAVYDEVMSRIKRYYESPKDDSEEDSFPTPFSSVTPELITFSDSKLIYPRPSKPRRPRQW